MRKYIEHRLRRSVMRLWKRRIKNIPRLSKSRLHDLRCHAASLRGLLLRFEALTESVASLRAPITPLPLGSRLLWRPRLWQGYQHGSKLPVVCSGAGNTPLWETENFCEIALYHDDPKARIIGTKVQVSHDHALQIDVLDFAGTVLSLIMNVPQATLDDLSAEHILRVDTQISLPKPLAEGNMAAPLFAQLNIAHGPNIARLPFPLIPDEHGIACAEFELSHSNIAFNNLQKIWVDIIWNAPDMGRLIIQDLTLSCVPRAQF